ncbi:TetR/AcrR family transcriptional regulator [Nonomuraea sp. KC401]|uniref:TetR/AcrR family transcriptional regulator n=1 Tax=unclassified Nonomuraea TaxID=2593643 RepID=UPI0010FDC9A6|nr:MULTISPECIES: TetR/AcrR family transcriptional regulator [unclassified Nonomuraea]NBE93821.1 TetR family transcriptional regulator [Nonomuraea sp. K271]TLF80675.1 TetR/AcrR family transcriptional regulator [Nonomuraea sp. KC401]
MAQLRADARRNRERILAAAESVFAEHGASASTEEVAARAEVAIGTVFRHFPTKNDLLGAIVKRLLDRLAEEAEALAEHGEPETALFAFFTHVVEEAAARKTVAELLAGGGVDVRTGKPLERLRRPVGTLLERAQRAGAVRREVGPDEVMALLAATSQAALLAGWTPGLRDRTLEIIFTGFRA